MIEPVEGIAPPFAAELAKATWQGDGDILPMGGHVEVLAVDSAGRFSRKLGWTGVPCRTVCWIRYWPVDADYAQYRSCDLADLDLSNVDQQRLMIATPERSMALEETDINRVFAENINDQAARLRVFPHNDGRDTPGSWMLRVRKAALLEALSASPIEVREHDGRGHGKDIWRD